MPKTDLLLSPGCVAKLLNLSTSRVIQLDREGVLPAMRDSAGRRLYDDATVRAFAKQREEQRQKVAERKAAAVAQALSARFFRQGNYVDQHHGVPTQPEGTALKA